MGLTVSGLGSSGLDVSSIVSQLMQVEQQPQNLLKQQLSDAQARKSAWSDIQNQLQSLQNAETGLQTAASFAVSTVSSSDSSVLTATADGSATPGSVTFQVQSIAVAQQQASAAVSGGTSATVGTGTLVVASGASNAGFTNITAAAGLADGTHSLTVKTGASTGGTATVTLDGTDYQVTVGGGPQTIGGLTIDTGSALTTGSVVNLVSVTTNSSTSLAGLASQLVSYSGVPATAAAVNVGDGTARLVLSASSAGTANALTVSGTGDLASFASGMSVIRNASDAQVSMGSMTISRSSNTITDLLPGVTLNLAKASPGEDVTISVGRDASATGAKVNALVNALNATIDLINKDTSYDTVNHVGQPLSGDFQATSMVSSLYTAMSSAVASGAPTAVLNQLGIALGQDGHYSFNQATFAAQLASDPVGVANLVAAAAKAVDGVVTQATSYNGWIATAQQGETSTINTLQGQIDDWDVRLADIQNQYLQQFSALDAAISQMKSQQQWLSGQLSSLSSGN